MTFWIFAAAITFSSFAVAATITSLLVGAVAPMVACRLERYAPASRAALLFRMRILPAAVAGLCSVGIALPIYLWFEPRDTDETLARTLVIAAAVGVSLLLRGAWRAVRAWRATRVVLRDWHQRGRRVHTVDAPIPVFAIEESFPTVAVVGFSRPVMFIAERVLRECTAEEVRAMMLHECAHVAERDNLKRFLIRACPDFLRVGSALDRAWAHATEEAADARAVAGHPGFALALAHALIRVARLAPRPATPELASAFYLGGSIESRVRRLVEPAEVADPNSASGFARPLGCVMACTLTCAFAALVVFAAPAVHQLMETVVRLLP